jgi:serine/threonine protein kinase
MPHAASSRAAGALMSRLAGGAASVAPATIDNRWTLARQIYAGSRFHVYQARPAGQASDAPGDYCLKTPIDDEDREAIASLRREAVLGQRIAHPHLLSALAWRLDEPPRYVVSPFLRGATLEAALTLGRPLALQYALWMTRQTAEALVVLHAAGWSHGDVKPDNIVVSPTGHATLIDLGFARRLGSMEHASGADWRGTLAYAAPETFSSALAACDRSDVYSLGVALYRLATGRLPFESKDAGELVAAQLRSRPADLREHVPALPSRLARLVSRMLSKEPLRRPSALEVVDALVALEIESL